MSMTMKLQHSQDTTMVTQKQGIVTILGCATETNTASATASLRRTLSADMSSIKWLPQNGFMKRIGSSEQLKNNIADNSGDYHEEETKEVVDGEAEAERERLEIWSSIQRNKKEEQEKAGTLDTWSSLLSLKTKDEISKSLPTTPYIHPLVKTKSSLSEKSLEICTESLGSETGSDGLVSSYPPSETEDSEEKEQEEREEEEEEVKMKEEVLPEEEEEVVKYNYHVTTTTKKSSSPRSFPPPLPSLSSQTGPSLHMRPYRDNGRLVLEAVSLPSQNNFCVQRQDGRLVLTFANTQEEVDENIEKENDADVVMEELEEEFEAFEEEKEGEDDEEDEYEDEEDGEESEIVIEKEKITNASTVNVNRLLASKVVNNNNNNKGIGLVNRNPKWSEKFNEVVNFEDVDVMETTQMVQSLPPRPPRVARLIPSPAKSSAAKAAAASFSFNAYENYWRTKPTAKDSVIHQVMNNDYAMKKNSGNKIIVSGEMNQVSNEKQQLLVLRGKNGDYLVHNLKSCKDSRRSFLFWEPYCIATS